MNHNCQRMGHNDLVYCEDLDNEYVTVVKRLYSILKFYSSFWQAEKVLCMDCGVFVVAFVVLIQNVKRW